MWRSILPTTTLLHATASVWSLIMSAPDNLLTSALGALAPSLVGLAATVLTAVLIVPPERFSAE